MDLETLTLDKNNPLIEDYRMYTKEMERYFHYHPISDSTKRYDYLMTQTYRRADLVKMLIKMNKSWDAPQTTLNQINRLIDDESVVVVGGQQAGLLTGPMYALNKVISIIKYAKEKESELGRPVIPLFWIAGEDHDFDEINHTYTLRAGALKKHTINQYEPIKKSVDELVIDQAACVKWLKALVNDMPETKYTKAWFDETVEALTASTSFVDFFARLIFNLFEEEGLVLFNAHDDAARQYEQDYFSHIFEHHDAIAKSVSQTKKMLENAGYPTTLDADETDVHLFYHDDNGERILLKSEVDLIIGKKNEVGFTKSELADLIRKHPEKFSNNVVTRPIMQELVFPTLAFIAGDGEIAYWASLKQAFEVLDLKMPPIVPRLSFTYLDEKLIKMADHRDINIRTIIEEGTMIAKQNWLVAQQPLDIAPLFSMTKENIKRLYDPLETAIESINHDLKREAQKNLTYIFRQVDYLKKRVQDETALKYRNELKQFDLLEHMLYPNQGLQERAFSPYLIINQYGKAFISELINDQSISFEVNHYIVKIEN